MASRVLVEIMKKKLWVSTIGVAVLASLAYFLASRYWFSATPRRISDPDFIMLENIPSPNEQHRILIYHYDTGALGYSRAWWAVTPSAYQDLDLTDYELPDGYMAKGWSSQNDLLVEKWEPYYYRQKLGELKTGEVFQGVKVKLLESANSKTGKDSDTHSSPTSSPKNGS
jgi:hypothetical protein